MVTSSGSGIGVTDGTRSRRAAAPSAGGRRYPHRHRSQVHHRQRQPAGGTNSILDGGDRRRRRNLESDVHRGRHQRQRHPNGLEMVTGPSLSVANGEDVNLSVQGDTTCSTVGAEVDSVDSTAQTSDRVVRTSPGSSRSGAVSVFVSGGSLTVAGGLRWGRRCGRRWRHHPHPEVT
jgi:hypothetical protein